MGEMTRYKGLVLSSNATRKDRIRAPEDAAHLLVLAKYAENALGSCTAKNSTVALVHAYGRQMGKCAIKLKRKTDDNDTVESSSAKVSRV